MRTLILILAAGVLYGQTELPAPAPEANQALFGAHLQRSMTLLATSSKERRWPVRVLIYGQSITGSSTLTQMIDKLLRERFPYADITLENRSIGGFEAPRLVRTAIHDLYPYYPDLLIFHVYGGELTGDLERIISDVRRYTTSDILIFNHHQNRDQKAVPEFGPKTIRYIAQKYDCELVDISTQWPRYLQENNFEPGKILRDNVHPNADGLALLTTFIGRHLQYNPLFPAPSGMSTVRWYEAKRFSEENATDEITYAGDPAGSALRLRFDGNRVELIAAHTKLDKLGSARILIDGKPPSEDRRLYTYTLPSKGPETWFPAIRTVGYQSLPLLEDWILRITKINADATRVEFRVEGSKTGFDGEGASTEKFVSRSGRVVIEPRDWMLADIMKIFHQTAPPAVGYEVRWKAVPMFMDRYQAPATPDSGKVYATTLAQGLTNAAHTIEIIPNGDGTVPIEALQVYRPPLR